MPPKRRKVPIPDWSWVGTEVTDPSDILPIHCRRAAGLEGLPPCPFNVSSSHPPSSSSSTALSLKGKERAANQDDDDDIQVLAVKTASCTAKRCRSWPRCYHHIGVEEVLLWKKEDLIEARLTGEIVKRNGSAGLRNLGALCYANAFLQVWYHNVAFRNGVYAAIQSIPEQLTPLHHLALLFASMGHSDRRVIDPTGLVESIELNKGDQQDAAEFSKLFTSLIENAFKRQGNNQVKNLISDLFEGKIEHATRCSTCKYVSKRQESFLELDLNLKNNATVEECLKASGRPEVLDGDNRYCCPQCKSLQPATRTSAPLVLPPVLNLSLMRFTFNGTNRVKNKAVIKYGRELLLGGVAYQLRAVVTHLGTSAHHGHFVCDVYNEGDDVWLHCNDEEIVNLNDRRKRPRMISDDLDLTSCKDAYMLVYKRIGSVHAEPPSADLLAHIEESNRELQKELDQRAVQQLRIEEDFEQIKGAKKDVIEVLPGVDHIVPTDQLEKWLSANTVEDLFKSWSFKAITCEHGAFDPSKSGDIRLISHDAHHKLLEYDGIPDLQVCRICVAAQFGRRMGIESRAKQVERFIKLATASTTGALYVLPQRWIDDWRKGETTDLPDHPRYMLFCDHGCRFDKKQKVEFVAPDSISYLQSLIGDFKTFPEHEAVCGECAVSQAAGDEEVLRWKAEVKDEKVILKELKNAYLPAFKVDYYLLPFDFVDRWLRWMKVGGDRPVLDMGLCDHGKLDWDPMMKHPKFISEKGWQEVLRKYGNVDPVTVRFDSNPLKGKRTNVAYVHPGVCEACRIKKALDFETAPIKIVIEEKGKEGRMDKRTRSKAKEVEFDVKKSTSVKQIKLELCARFGLSPMYQSLVYNGKELVSEDTIESARVLAEDEIVCKVLQEEEEMKDVVGRTEGFRGTALSGLMGKACPQCTYVSPAGVKGCEVCDMPFE